MAGTTELRDKHIEATNVLHTAQEQLQDVRALRQTTYRILAGGDVSGTDRFQFEARRSALATTYQIPSEDTQEAARWETRILEMEGRISVLSLEEQAEQLHAQFLETQHPGLIPVTADEILAFRDAQISQTQPNPDIHNRLTAFVQRRFPDQPREEQITRLISEWADEAEVATQTYFADVIRIRGLSSTPQSEEVTRLQQNIKQYEAKQNIRTTYGRALGRLRQIETTEMPKAHQQLGFAQQEFEGRTLATNHNIPAVTDLPTVVETPPANPLEAMLRDVREVADLTRARGFGGIWGYDELTTERSGHGYHYGKFFARGERFETVTPSRDLGETWLSLFPQAEYFLRQMGGNNVLTSDTSQQVLLFSPYQNVEGSRPKQLILPKGVIYGEKDWQQIAYYMPVVGHDGRNYPVMLAVAVPDGIGQRIQKMVTAHPMAMSLYFDALFPHILQREKDTAQRYLGRRNATTLRIIDTTAKTQQPPALYTPPLGYEQR